MQMSNMFPPGRVLWAMRDSDLHPSHRSSSNFSSASSSSSAADSGRAMTKMTESCLNPAAQDKLRLFEVLDVERVFSQIVFARDMLTCVLFSLSLLFLSDFFFGFSEHICRINMTRFFTICCDEVTGRLGPGILIFFHIPDKLTRI